MFSHFFNDRSVEGCLPSSYPYAFQRKMLTLNCAENFENTLTKLKKQSFFLSRVLVVENEISRGC